MPLIEMSYEEYNFEIPLGGIQLTSTIDFPGRLSTVIFLEKCNFRCPYCHNPSLLSSSGKKEKINSILEKLLRRREWVDSVVITGGEPLLYDGILSLIRSLKRNGFKIKLDTNGSFPLKLKEIIEKNCPDYIAMDIKTTFKKYSELGPKGVEDKIRNSILILKSNMKDNAYEFRTTLCPKYTDLEELKTIASYINGKNWVWQQFNPDITLDPTYKDIQPFDQNTIYKYLSEVQEIFSTKIKIRGIT